MRWRFLAGPSATTSILFDECLVTCTTQIGTSADGSCRGDRGARRKSMSLHRQRLVTKISPATPIGPEGSCETALSSSSSAPRNIAVFTRRRDIESSPSRRLESNAVWPERWSRFAWYRPLVWIVRAKLTSFSVCALDCVHAGEGRVNFRRTLPVRVAIPHEHSESPDRF